jgi:hypothetical protein
MVDIGGRINTAAIRRLQAITGWPKSFGYEHVGKPQRLLRLKKGALFICAWSSPQHRAQRSLGCAPSDYPFKDVQF